MRSSGERRAARFFSGESVHCVSCPKHGLEMETVVLHRVGFLE